MRDQLIGFVSEKLPIKASNEDENYTATLCYRVLGVQESVEEYEQLTGVRVDRGLRVRVQKNQNRH